MADLSGSKKASKKASKEADEIKRQTAIEKAKEAQEKAKAQRILTRSLRARSGGFFESDSVLGSSDTLG